MNETFRGRDIGGAGIHTFEPIGIVTKIDPLAELQKRTATVGVHPLTFEMIKEILIPGRKHPISDDQLILLITYYTTDFSFMSVQETLKRMNKIGLLENCIANLRKTLSGDQQQRFPIEKTPIFKRVDLGLLTDEEKDIYLHVFDGKTGLDNPESTTEDVRVILLKAREIRMKYMRQLNSARHPAKKV